MDERGAGAAEGRGADVVEHLTGAAGAGACGVDVGEGADDPGTGSMSLDKIENARKTEKAVGAAGEYPNPKLPNFRILCVPQTIPKGQSYVYFRHC